MSDQEIFNTEKLLPTGDAERFGRTARGTVAREHEREFRKWFDMALAGDGDKALPSHKVVADNGPGKNIDHPLSPAIPATAIVQDTSAPGFITGKQLEQSISSTDISRPVISGVTVNQAVMGEGLANPGRAGISRTGIAEPTGENILWKFPDFLDPAKVQLVKSADGIVVLIVDSNLKQSHYGKIVQFFRNAFSATGHGLARIRINGETVYELSQDGSAEVSSHEQHENGLNKVY